MFRLNCCLIAKPTAPKGLFDSLTSYLSYSTSLINNDEDDKGKSDSEQKEEFSLVTAPQEIHQDPPVDHPLEGILFWLTI